ncbi:MAG: HlyD family efflux transporter periplasmic adaptor subunit, partial [Clostridia bacterium]
MKNLSKQFIVAIIALAILGYVGLQISLSTKDAVQVENAMYAQAKKTISTDAYIFRDEIPIVSNTNGTVCYFFDDGEKIAKGQPIVTTYALSTDADVQKKINEINKKIKILEKSSTNSNISAGDLNNMDNAITNGVVNIAKAIGSKSIGNVDLQEYDLLIALNKKRSAMATINGYEMQIEQKKAEKSRLQSQLSGSSDVQNAASAGYLYSYVDGYENIFTADLLKKM